MGPEFYLQIANFLNLFLQLIEQLFKFLDFGKLLIDMLHFVRLFLNIGLHDVLVSEDSELLLNVRSLFLSNF